MGIQRNKLACLVVAATLLATPAFADSGLEPIQKTKAYQMYKRRPASNFSKLIYLIDRFGQSKVEITYSGIVYQSLFAAKLARWFLVHKYRKQTPEEWIELWCHKSVIDGSVIWVKMPDGSRRQANQLLLDELKDLEQALAADKLAAASHAAAVAIPGPNIVLNETRATPPAVEAAPAR